MRVLLNFVHHARQLAWRVLRLKTRGARVMLFNASDEILLIRHAYGRSDLFLFPGGGVRSWETPAQAARREVKEEVGCGVADLTLVSTHFTTAEGKRDTVYLFRATSSDEPVADGVEVEEARFFPLGDLPAAVSPATKRRIEEYLGSRQPDGSW